MDPKFTGWTGFGWAMAAAAVVIVLNGKAARMSQANGGTFTGLQNVLP